MSKISVTHIENLPLADLEEVWERLYPKCRANIFLSWAWVGTWIQTLPFSYQVIIAKDQESIVGLGVFVENRITRRTVIPSRQLYLHRTGRLNHDQTWIEYNDFLIQEQSRNAIRYAIADYLVNNMQWDELAIGASEAEVFTPFKLLGFMPLKVWENVSYQADLKSIRESEKSYLSTRSSNTRYQINRSLRRYEKKGKVIITRAETVEQALTWFDEAGPLHKERWQGHKNGSGFNNLDFVNFHKRFITQSVPDGLVDILKIQAGDYVIAYLFNIIQDKEVKFYLSANRYDDSDKKLKPGLVAHHLAINYYNDRHFDTYDFMGGDSQYKRSLASHSVPLYFMNIQRPNLTFKIENTLRKIKQRYLTHESAENRSEVIKFILTGGCQNEPGHSPQYNKARAVSCLYDPNNEELTLQTSIDYQPVAGIQHPETNVTFKAGSIYDNTLWIPTETELLECDLQTFKVTNSHSHNSFNDIHHVIQHNGQLLVANTGNNCITALNPDQETVKHYSATHHVPVVIDQTIDYRQVKSTKPHLAHPNFCFILNNKIWVTRCDLMDAVCVEDAEQRIDIGYGLIHDGVVFDKHIYFTTVDGKIIAFDTETLKQTMFIDLNGLTPDINCWCRGILPISPGRVLVGMSKLRASKRHIGRKLSPSQVVCVDLYKQQLLWRRDTRCLGIDTLFSILPAPNE
jgi:hypothetical protein